MPVVFFILSLVHNILNALQYILLPLCNKLNKEEARDPNDNYEIVDTIIKDTVQMRKFGS